LLPGALLPTSITAAAVVALLEPTPAKHPGPAVFLPLVEVPEAATVAASFLLSETSSLTTLPFVGALVAAVVPTVVPAPPFKSLQTTLLSLVEASASTALSEGLSPVLVPLPSSSTFPSVALRTRPGILDPDHLPADPLAIEVSDGGVGLALGGHLHEAEGAAALEGLEE
jgi:hypothetical protein